jgi:hypothetical protein
MAGYTRQSTYTDGDVINASDSNNEYDQLVNAFSNTGGHKHDGTTAEGPVIGLIGDPGVATPKNKVVVDDTNNRVGVFVDVSGTSTEQLRLQDGAIVPVTDNDIDLGTSSAEFKDAFFDGTVTTDALVADTADINGGSVDGATLGTNSAITQAVVDNININGATIGHTSDTDLMTLASGVLTVAGEVSMTTLDIGGTDVTATAAELNILDGVTATASELNIMDGVTATTAELNIMDGVTATTAELNLMDGGTSAGTTAVAGGDGIVTNDAGTMRQTTVDTFDTYLAQTTKTLTNKTIDVDNNTVSNIEVDNLKSGVLDTDLSSVSGSDDTLASAKAIKAYVDAQIQTEDTIAELNDTNISSLASGHILIYDGTDTFDNKAVSGDIALSSTGAATIQSGAVESAMLNANVITGQTAITSGLDTSNDEVLIHDADAGALKRLTLGNLSSSLGGLSDIVNDTTPQLGGNLDTNSHNIQFDDAHGIQDDSGNEFIVFQKTASAVNQLDITNAATGSGPEISATGDDTNIDMTLTPKGSGVVNIDGNGSSGGVSISDGLVDIRTGTGARSQVKFYCESSNAHAQTLQPQPHSAGVTNTLTLPAGGNQELVGASATQTLTNKSIDASQLTGTVANARLDAQLQDVAGLAVTDGNFIVGDGSNFVAESGATARTSLGLGSAAVLTAGTSANNAVQLDGSARLPAVDGSQLTNLPSAGATAGFAVAMAIAL